jgi:D-alanine-D-alanine ligase
MSLGLQNIDEVASKAGRVGVLMGGCSAEREISLKSGEMIFNALTTAGVEAVKLVWNDDLRQTLASDTYDRVFIALHGRGGEDGQVQGLLGLHDIPYTGSRVLGSALAMDKVRSKQVWQASGLPTPEFFFISREMNIDLASVPTFPVMIKPAREGSSIGISKVDNQRDLAQAIETALAFDELILVEQFVVGAEYTLSILNGQTLPLIRLETPNEFYDYEAKYLSDSTQYHCPAGLSAGLEKQCAELGLRAFLALGASGWGRVDFMLDGDLQPQLIEVNTVPGMTDHSLVPMAAAAAGINFEQLVMQILSTSFGGSNG